MSYEETKILPKLLQFLAVLWKFGVYLKPTEYVYFSLIFGQCTRISKKAQYVSLDPNPVRLPAVIAAAAPELGGGFLSIQFVFLLGASQSNL